MQNTMRKIRRVQPLIRMKQSRVDEESSVLGRIRSEKVQLVQSMKDSQRRYMAEIDQLNRLRGSPQRTNLETIEASVDYIKDQWWQLYRRVQEVERREQSQLHQVLIAEKELKAVEKLREKYETEYAQQLRRVDQKRLDEFGGQRHSETE